MAKPEADHTQEGTEAARPSRAEMDAYAGSYYSEELGATWTVTATDSTLVLKTRWGSASGATVRPAPTATRSSATFSCSVPAWPRAQDRRDAAEHRTSSEGPLREAGNASRQPSIAN